MHIEILTKSDLEQVADRIIDNIKAQQVLEIDGSPTFGWVSESQAMKLLEMGKTTIRKYRNCGTLPFAQWHGKIYYRLTDLDHFLNATYNG